MTMIPGAFEPRPQRGVLDLAPIARVPITDRVAVPSASAAAAREWPGWLQVSIFAAGLLGVTWLAMLAQSMTR